MTCWALGRSEKGRGFSVFLLSFFFGADRFDDLDILGFKVFKKCNHTLVYVSAQIIADKRGNEVGKSDLTRSNLIWFSDLTGKARELILLRLHVAEVERKLFSV